MIGKKKLSEIKAELARLLRSLPGQSPRSWLKKEIETAANQPGRDVETLEMLCAALEREAKKKRKHRPRPAASRPA